MRHHILDAILPVCIRTKKAELLDMIPEFRIKSFGNGAYGT